MSELSAEDRMRIKKAAEVTDFAVMVGASVDIRALARAVLALEERVGRMEGEHGAWIRKLLAIHADEVVDTLCAPSSPDGDGERPTRWRKKPVEVEVVQYRPTTCALLHEWLGYEHVIYKGEQCGVGEFIIETANGPVEAQPGDYVCRQFVDGRWDVWPVKAAVFAATYEPADAPAAQPRTLDALCEEEGALGEAAGGIRWAAQYDDIPVGLSPEQVRALADYLSRLPAPQGDADVGTITRIDVTGSGFGYVTVRVPRAFASGRTLGDPVTLLIPRTPTPGERPEGGGEP